MKYNRKPNKLKRTLLVVGTALAVFLLTFLLSGCESDQVGSGECYQRTVRSVDCMNNYVVVGQPEHFEGYDIELCCPANNKSLQDEMMLHQHGRPY